MKYIVAIILVSLYSCLLTGCFLFTDKNPEPQLPAITQEGKRTFGCKVNGQVWLPRGFDGTPNLEITYDPTYGWGILNVRAYQIKDGSRYQSIGFYSDSLTTTGVYPLNKPGKQTGKFTDFKPGCFYNREVTVSEGTLIITKLDEAKRIIAGTFEFTLAMPNCDTIRVTEGRFDMKY